MNCLPQFIVISLTKEKLFFFFGFTFFNDFRFFNGFGYHFFGFFMSGSRQDDHFILIIQDLHLIRNLDVTHMDAIPDIEKA